VTFVRSVVFSLFCYVWFVIVAVGCTPLLLASDGVILGMFRVWATGNNLLLRVICNVRVEVRGRQYIPTGAALVAPKHQSMLDVFAQFTWLPASSFVTKKELMGIPFFSWYAKRVRMIEVDREAGSAALRKLVKDAKERFEEGRQVVIFPEGHRGAPGVAGDYKPGIAALYREIDVSVYPVATNSGVHVSPNGFFRKPGTIVFEYLEPIPPGLKRAEFMRILEERIETASIALLSE
jgi:1-acyl-sn-glycerol-3-phosphate acyltransferase